MKSRVLTALILIPIVLLCFAADSVWPVAGLAFIAAVICCAEVGKLIGGQPLIALLGIPACAAIVAYSSLPYGFSSGLNVLAVAALVGILSAAFLKGNIAGLVASLWVVAPLAAIAVINAWNTGSSIRLDLIPYPGFRLDRPVLLCVLPIWVGDTAAIFVGKAIGKHKLWLAVSPSKTWEGGIANLLGCIAAGGLLAHTFHVSLTTGLLIGVSCGIFGQAGDLFESWLKRKADVKDSGTLLPGHGGLLDRLDSLLFAAIPSCLILVSLR